MGVILSMYSDTFRQAVASYPYSGDVMLDTKKNFVLSTDEKKKLNSSIKLGIYKELNKKTLLTDNQLSFLIEKEKKKIYQ